MAEDVTWRPAPGADWHITMIAPDGEKFQHCGTFLAVEASRLLAFSHHWISDGCLSEQTSITVAFTETDLGTQVHFCQSGFMDPEERDVHRDGWDQCLDRFRRDVEFSLVQDQSDPLLSL